MLVKLLVFVHFPATLLLIQVVTPQATGLQAQHCLQAANCVSMLCVYIKPHIWRGKSVFYSTTIVIGWTCATQTTTRSLQSGPADKRTQCVLMGCLLLVGTPAADAAADCPALLLQSQRLHRLHKVKQAYHI